MKPQPTDPGTDKTQPLRPVEPDIETVIRLPSGNESPTVPPVPGAPSPFRPDIPGYTIQGELGRGGMGVVYKARQLTADRPVALKVILQGPLAAPDQIIRFRTEAAAVARLVHPNIVQLYEAGDAGGIPFFSLEFVEGGPLSSRLAAGPLAPADAARLVRQLATAVQYAHSRGILHRDLKPANVLLAADGTPKVADFGLAKRLDGDERLTATGAVVGTPAYMAPEQAAGRTAEVGTAADVYALGVILYECLTGRVPFDHPNMMEAMRAVVQDEPPPVRRFARDCPPDLATIIHKCLEKDPSRRYPTAQALADDLGRFLECRPVEARPATITYRLSRWAVRQPALAALLVLSVLGALVTLVGGVWYQTRLAGERDKAIRAEAEAGSRLQRLRDAHGISRLESSDPFAALPWFAASLADGDGPARRLRLAATLRACPPLGRLWFHRAPLTAAAFSADGERVLTASADHTARVWDAASGAPIGRPWEHPAAVLDACFVPGGPFEATACADGGVRVRDPEGDAVREFTGHGAAVLAITASADGTLLASASADGTARVWDVASGKPKAVLRHDGPVNSVHFGPDGLVATGSDDGTARLWRADTGKEVGGPIRHGRAVRWVTFGTGSLLASAGDDGLVRIAKVGVGGAEQIGELAHSGPVVRVEFSADGGQVVTASKDHTAVVWGLKGRRLAMMRHASPVTWVGFSPNGTWAASGSDDNTARIWEAATGELVCPPLRHNGTVSAGAFSADGRRLLTASEDVVARIWELGTLPVSLDAGAPLSSLAWDPAGRRLVTGRIDGVVAVWDADTLRLLWQGADRHTGPVRVAAFSADGSAVLSASPDDPVARVWDAASGDTRRPLRLEGGVTAAEFSPDGKHVVTAGPRGCRAWNLVTGTAVGPAGWDGPTAAASFSPDGRRIAAGCDDGNVRVWDAATGARLLDPLPHGGPVRSAVFSPDGRRLLSASADMTAQFWDAATGKALFGPLEHSGVVASAAWSADGSLAVTTSDDNTARVWEAATGRPHGPAFPHRGTVVRAEFAPHAPVLATASTDGGARAWDLDTGELLLPPTVHAPEAVRATFRPGGKMLASAGTDGRVRFASLESDARPPAELTDRARLLAGAEVRGEGTVPLDAEALRVIWARLGGKH